MERPLRIGTRGSPLALAQARMAAAALCAAHGWALERIEIVPIVTSGDRAQDRPLAEIGGKALWTKELDRCLLDGRTDVSVHSMKDVETFRPVDLAIAAILPRADVRDRLVGAASLDALAPGARVGTSSPRRAAQVLRCRPDLRIVAFRGNVQTRLDRVARGEAEATILAGAGLDRLGMSDVGTPLDLLPAPAQGAVGIEVHAERGDLRTLVAAAGHRETEACIAAERGLLEGLGGDCRSPIAALAQREGDLIRLRAQIYAIDGSEAEAGEARFAPGDVQAPLDLAAELLARAPASVRSLFAR